MIINRDTASLEAKVYTELEEAILADELKKGEALTELGISEKLGVSRTPVRGALHRLAEEGLIEIAPNRGAVVVGVTKEDLIDVYRIRMRLEGLASAMAAEKMTPEERKHSPNPSSFPNFICKKKTPSISRSLTRRSTMRSTRQAAAGFYTESSPSFTGTSKRIGSFR